MKSLPCILVCAIATIASTDRGFIVSQSIGVSHNPLGALLDTKLFYRMPLIKKEGILWESTKIETGIQNEWTPADNRISAWAAIEPIALFDIVIKGGYYAMFDNLGYGCFRMNSAGDPYDDAAQKVHKPDDAHGYWLSVAPTLKAKLGRVIALNTATINRIVINGRSDFLEVQSYLAHRTADVDIVNESYLLYECTKAFLAGANYHYAAVAGTGARSQRLGVLGMMTPGSLVPYMSAALNVGFYPDDPLFAKKPYVAGLVGVDVPAKKKNQRSH
jgi:hypothetical protein